MLASFVFFFLLWSCPGLIFDWFLSSCAVLDLDAQGSRRVEFCELL